MRLALNHTYLRREGGVERYVSSLVERLLERGYRVDFFGIKCDGNLKFLGHPNFKFVKIPVFKGNESLKALSFSYLSASMIAREGPYDVVMGFSKGFYQNVYRDGSGCRRDYLKAMGIKPRGPFRFYEAVLEFLERKRYSFPGLSRVITVSNMVKSQIVRRYPWLWGRVETVYSAVSTGNFMRFSRREARERLQAFLSIPKDAKLFLFVGNDFVRKGLDVALSAFSETVSFPWILVVLGKDSKNFGRFKRECERMGVSQRVVFLGFRYDKELFFRGSDVFVLPTKFDAIANVILEALVSGTFSLVSSFAGGSELLREGLDGFRISGASDLKEKLIDIFTKATIPSADFTHFAERFSWESHIKVLERVFRSASPL